MKERGWIEPIVERVVGQVLESHASQLRTEIVRRVMEELAAESSLNESVDEPMHHESALDHPAISQPASDPVTSAHDSADLARAVSDIQLGTSQKEILRALLDTSSRYAARVALFVVKGNRATGWQGRGFANNDALKDFALDENAPAVVHAIGRRSGDRAVSPVPVADLDSRFLDQFGTPVSGEGRILPLLLKDKVAALIYADSGIDASGRLDAGSLELLVLSTSAWLEVSSLRKQTLKEPSPALPESHSVPAADAPGFPVPPPALNDPFASHAPAFSAGHAKAAAASAGDRGEANATASVDAPAMVAQHAMAPVQAELQSAVVEMEPDLGAPLSIGHAETVAAPEPSPPVLSPEEQDIHRKAQRFSRLLVDEIKLYNQAKVAEGRQNKDLYDRLKEVIEKSRMTYHKRYGNTVAASANYFEHEIIRSLAEDDPSIMGANFRQ